MYFEMFCLTSIPSKSLVEGVRMVLGRYTLNKALKNSNLFPITEGDIYMLDKSASSEPTSVRPYLLCSMD